MGASREYHGPKGFTLIKTFIVLIIIGLIVGLPPVIWKLVSPPPLYDLLFSIDFNGVPYSDPTNPGVVARVENHKVHLSVPGAGGGLGLTLYFCSAATGIVSEAPQVPYDLQVSEDRHEVRKSLSGRIPLRAMPELERLTVDDSSVAPDGRSIPGVDFSQPYPVFDLVDRLVFPNSNFSALLDVLTLHLISTYENDSYVKCLQQVKYPEAGVTVHFIGWVLPMHASSR